MNAPRERRKRNQKLTNKTPRVPLMSTSFSKQASTNCSACFVNLPSGNRGAGSLTIWCINSIMDMVFPPPCRLTPLLFLLVWWWWLWWWWWGWWDGAGGCWVAVTVGVGVDDDEFINCIFAVAAVIMTTLSSSKSGNWVAIGGDVVTKSDSSVSEKGKRPVASSTSVMPRDHISDLTEYSAPWIRSGWSWFFFWRRWEGEGGKGAYAHVDGSTDKGVGYRVDEFPRDAKVAEFYFALSIAEDVGGFDV